MTVSNENTARPESIRAVVVEDVPDLLRNISRCLRLMGFSVFPFPSAELALDYIDAQPGSVDIVIADMNLPGISGLQMATNLKATHNIPFILSSGTRPGLETAPLLVDKVLFKPVPVRTLAQVAVLLVEKRKKASTATP